MDNKDKAIYTLRSVHIDKDCKDLSFIKLKFFYKMIEHFGWGLFISSLYIFFNNKAFLFPFIIAIVWFIYKLFNIIIYQYQNIVYFKNSANIYFYEDYLSREIKLNGHTGIYKYLVRMNNRFFKSTISPIKYSQIKYFKMYKDFLLIFTKYEYISIPKESYSLDFVCFLSSKMQTEECTSGKSQSIANGKLNTVTESYYVYDALKENFLGNIGILTKLSTVLICFMITSDENFWIIAIVNVLYTGFLIFLYRFSGNGSYTSIQKIKSVVISNNQMLLYKYKINGKNANKLDEFLNGEGKIKVWNLEDIYFSEDKKYVQLHSRKEEEILSVLFDKKRQDVSLRKIVEALDYNNKVEIRFYSVNSSDN